jgi:glycosyltransferase involved in cell wall biosynthesis
MDFQEFKIKYQREEVVHFPNAVDSKPLVSVLVQTYQHRDYIKDCLNNILAQKTSFPFEILLGDDASTDGTREICIEFAKKYPKKIRLILHHPNNKIKIQNVPTGNFNALYNFYLAKGDYVAFCEGDDNWRDNLKLQKQVDFLIQNKKFVLSYHSYQETDSTGIPLPLEKCLNQSKKDLEKKDLKLLKDHPLLSTVCFRNLIRKNIPEEMVSVINVDSFLLSFLGIYGGGKFHDTILSSLYRRHSGGIWSKRVKQLKLKSKILTYQKLQEFYTQREDFKTAKHFSKKAFKIKKMQMFQFFSRIKNLNF